MANRPVKKPFPAPKKPIAKSFRPAAPAKPVPEPEHEGATEDQVGDLSGPGAGYDDEPKKVRNRGGVS